MKSIEQTDGATGVMEDEGQIAPVIILTVAPRSIWLTNCLEALRVNGYSAERRHFNWGSIKENEADGRIFVCSIVSIHTPEFILSERAVEHGGRVAEYFGKLDPAYPNYTEGVTEEGSLVILKRNDPDFRQLIQWIKDPEAQARNLAATTDRYLNRRYRQLYHDKPV